MAKNAAKKRRRGISKVTKKSKNTFRYKKPSIDSEVVRSMWNDGMVAEANLARMGLRANANSNVIRPEAKALAEATGRLPQGDEVARLFDVPDTDDLKVLDRNVRRRPMSDDDQQYTVKLMERFGLDHEAMARDLKTNYKQLTLGQVRRMCTTLLSLGDDQRVVDIPKRVLLGAEAEAAETATG
ncbi:unnamed protein product, partial [Sphacelaria rigidula]